MIEVFHISAFQDNYIWLIKPPSTSLCAIIDPGDATPVLRYLHEKQLNLAAILVTHHHHDHTGGITRILEASPVPVYGSINSQLPQITHPVSPEQIIQLTSLDFQFKILGIPGHTRDHIAYYGHQCLFAGDTLFAAGCGRLFEGNAEQMYGSLMQLSQLPDETKLYCGHEYTQQNLEFAQLVEPDNLDIKIQFKKNKKRLATHQTTLPTTLKIEKTVNPFLRCHLPSVKQAAESHAKQHLHSPVEVFAVIRTWKDEF